MHELDKIWYKVRTTNIAQFFKKNKMVFALPEQVFLLHELKKRVFLMHELVKIWYTVRTTHIAQL